MACSSALCTSSSCKTSSAPPAPRSCAGHRLRRCPSPSQSAEALADAGVAQLLGDHLAGEEVLLHELAEAATELCLAVRMTAVWGMGRPSGWRNSAVTANQSARPPTIAASAVART